MTTRRQRSERTALDHVEEATHLLRNAPGGVVLRYYVGAVPCVLGLLYFFTDVTRGAFARDHLIGASLSAALLYLWMKCWHTAFNSGLRDSLAGRASAPWTAARVGRLVFLQAAVQPWGLFVRLLAAQMLLPYVWVMGFFEGFGVFGDGVDGSLSGTSRRAWTQAKWQPGQAHAALAYLKLFAFCIWLNVMATVFFLPQLLRIFTGIETVFTLSPMAMLNSTVFFASIGMTYLFFDPMRKAFTVLRCHDAESLRTGQDLAIELKQMRAASTNAARFAAAALFLFSIAPLAPNTAAAAAEPIAPAGEVDPAALDRAIGSVLERREYTWRQPHEMETEADEGWFVKFVRESIQWTRDTMQRISDWLRRPFRSKSNEGSFDADTGFGWSSRGAIYLAIAATAALLALLWWRHRRSLHGSIVAAQPFVAVPDLRSEDVTADQLPEDGWLRLARELMDQGELRLALRASYLASLAHLGRRELISIARHKSNLDYERELRRRARSRDDLLAAFDENLSVFERAWYGLHDVTREMLSGFNANLEKIRAC
jgi:hypothetical protein